MSPRKTRRGIKDESIDASLQDLNITKMPDTPETTRRTLRTRRQLRQKNSSDSDVEQSPKLNESKRTIRRGRSKKVIDTVDDSTMNVTITSTRKKTRKDNETSVFENTTITDHETQVPVSAAKLKINRNRKGRAQKKGDIISNNLDNAENSLNDQNIINDISKYLITEKNGQDVDTASNEDDEVANVSKKVTKNTKRTPIQARFLQPRNSSVDSPNSIVTPKCSPLAVNLTPHRTTKTPRKSPINLGSPKTHSLSPQRLSKTPRKLPVTADSPEPKENSFNKTHQEVSSDEIGNMSITHSPAIRSSNRRASKSPKIVLRTSNSNSPRVISTKVKKSPNLTKNSSIKSPQAQSPKKSNSASKKILNKKAKSPLLILDKISPPIEITSSPENSITPAISPNAWKKLISDADNLRKQKSLIKKRSPVKDSCTPLRTLSTPKVDDMKRVSDKLKIISTNNTPSIQLAAKKNSALTSSTPRERIRRSLNLSPNVSGEPLGVQNFYGTSSLSARFNNNDQSIRIEDESSVLITDDDSSFDISGIKAVEKSKIDETLIDDEVTRLPDRAEKTLNDTYELEEPLTPSLRKHDKTNNDTYELDEPKTPALRKRRSLIETNPSETEQVKEQIPPKRVCRVRFASPMLNSPLKVASKKKTPVRLSTPANKGLRKRKLSHIINPSPSNLKSVKAKISQRNRSNSLTNLNTEAPNVSGVKKRSLSAMDMSSRSAMKHMQNKSVNRLSRPRLSITSDKKSSEVKTTSAKKAPNFTQIHQKKFEKLESLVDAIKRVEERHNALTGNVAVTPGTSKTVSNSSSRVNAIKAVPTETTNGAFNRFGYKVRKETAMKLVNKQPATKRSTEKKVEKRLELKGVRLNRRFELQMKMRNINP